MVTAIQKASAWPRLVQLACTAVGIVFGVLVQMPLNSKGIGDPFTVFIALVFVSTLMFGGYCGWLAVVLSAIMSTLFFDPVGSLVISHVSDFMQILIYALLAAGAVLLANEIHQAVLAQAAANANLVSEGQFKSLQLQEVAHRVANNFSSLDALFRQRAATSKDPQIKMGFEQASELVHIVARLNNRLGNLGNEG
jgi:K+-sensing histidine kinase KdpD